MSAAGEGRRPRFAGLVFRLYPASFRRRAGAEWWEIVAWRRRGLAGGRMPGLRLAAFLLLDAWRAAPAAHLRAFRERRRARAAGPDGSGRGGPKWRRARRMVEAGLHNLRHVLRSLRRSPGFLVVSVTCLALGIGANTALFSVVKAVLLDPLPYRDSDRLTIIWNEFPTSGLSRLPLSGVEVEELRAEPGVFAAVGGIWGTSRTLVGTDGTAEQVSAGLVTPNFFDVLGVGPQYGTAFERGPGNTPVPQGVLLSDEVWRARFGGDTAVIGSTIFVDGQPNPVIGVMPRGFKLFFPPDGSIPERVDLFVPLPWDLTLLPADQHFLRVVGRLRPGVELPAAQAGVLRAAERARSKYSELQATGDRFTVHAFQVDSVRAARPVLVALQIGGVLFLLLATINVANLMLARVTARLPELMLLSALGASRARLMGMAVLESATVALLGGTVGLWLGSLGGQVLWAIRPRGIARVDVLSLDPGVVAVSLLTAGVAALVCGVAPLGILARRSAAPHLRVSVAAARSTPMRGRQVLTVGEVAIALVLLVGAVLVGKTLSRLQNVDPGFDAGGALTVRVALPVRRFPADSTRSRLADEVERRLGEIPGVSAAGATSHLPFAQWANWGSAAPPDGTPAERRDEYFGDHRAVTPGYLEAVGARLVEGRWFNASDGTGREPVAVVDRTMARRLFPDGSAVGRVIHPQRYVDASFVSGPTVIVGVIEDLRDVSPSRPSSGQVFVPYAQSPRWELTWVARTAGDPATLADLVVAAVQSAHRDLVPAAVTPFVDYERSAMSRARFIALLGTLFSLLAVLLAGVGLYGVINFVAVQRTREYALRIALGADRRRVIGNVLRGGIRLGVIGVVIGLVTAWGLSGFMRTLLYDVSPRDPWTLALSAVLLVAVVTVASTAPAFRAARSDPLAMLRE